MGSSGSSEVEDFNITGQQDDSTNSNEEFNEIIKSNISWREDLTGTVIYMLSYTEDYPDPASWNNYQETFKADLTASGFDGAGSQLGIYPLSSLPQGSEVRYRIVAFRQNAKK